MPLPTGEPQRRAQLIESQLLRSIGMTALFTERRGGVSQPPFDTLNCAYDIGDDSDNVTSNIERVVQTSGLASRPHQAGQIHNTNHLFCSGKGKIHNEQADILITTEANCPIAVRTADCLPLLLADPVARVVAAVHAGWRGTAQRIAIEALKVMQERGASVENIYATLGPCIGPCCFEIDVQTARQLADSAYDGETAITQHAKPHADLLAINTLQLQEAGIPEAQIETHRLCTCCHGERFFSYRRDRGISGRHLAVVALPDDI